MIFGHGKLYTVGLERSYGGYRTGPHEPLVAIDADSGSHCYFLEQTRIRDSGKKVHVKFINSYPHGLAFLNMAFIRSMSLCERNS